MNDSIGDCSGEFSAKLGGQAEASAAQHQTIERILCMFGDSLESLLDVEPGTILLKFRTFLNLNIERTELS